MTVGIAGLGLIGGSMARALKAKTNHRVLGYDKNNDTMQAALKEGAIDAVLGADSIASCSVVIVALYPDAAIEYVSKNADKFAQDCIVIDCCGVKQHICTPLFALAKEKGFSFYGGHPMAGTQFSGFESSRENLFCGASMIIVPPEGANEQKNAMLEAFFKDIGFGYVTLTDAITHDKIIAYTSQLAHVVSSAYVKSPNALIHGGFSAGSFRDLTRVAALNEDMWTELFVENAEFLAWEIDRIAEELGKYSKAIREKDKKTLHTLLEEGTRLKKMTM